jgi:hypothetical protein
MAPQTPEDRTQVGAALRKKEQKRRTRAAR